MYVCTLLIHGYAQEQLTPCEGVALSFATQNGTKTRPFCSCLICQAQPETFHARSFELGITFQFLIPPPSLFSIMARLTRATVTGSID